MDLWYESLLKHSARIVLDMSAIKELNKGLRLGYLLELPSDVRFSHQHMIDLITAENRVNSLILIQ